MKQSTKLLFLVLRRPAEALKTYTTLLTYTKSAVTRNYAEKTINGILDYVGGGKGGPVEVDVLERFYQATKDALEEAKNEVFAPCSSTLETYLIGSSQRLSVKTNLKLAKLWLDRKEYDRLSKVMSTDLIATNRSLLNLTTAYQGAACLDRYGNRQRGAISEGDPAS